MHDNDINTFRSAEREKKFNALYYLQGVKDKHDRLSKVKECSKNMIDQAIFKSGSFGFSVEMYRDNGKEAFQKFLHVIRYCQRRGTEAIQPNEVKVFEDAKALIALLVVREPQIKQHLTDIANSKDIASTLAASILEQSEELEKNQELEQDEEPEQRTRPKLR